MNVLVERDQHIGKLRGVVLCEWVEKTHHRRSVLRRHDCCFSLPEILLPSVLMPGLVSLASGGCFGLDTKDAGICCVGMRVVFGSVCRLGRVLLWVGLNFTLFTQRSRQCGSSVALTIVALWCVVQFDNRRH